jgi:hypothetical protein
MWFMSSAIWSTLHRAGFNTGLSARTRPDAAGRAEIRVHRRRVMVHHIGAREPFSQGPQTTAGAALRRARQLAVAPQSDDIGLAHAAAPPKFAPGLNSSDRTSRSVG